MQKRKNKTQKNSFHGGTLGNPVPVLGTGFFYCIRWETFKILLVKYNRWDLNINFTFLFFVF